jgi:hydroxyacylglutathione hydrolase
VRLRLICAPLLALACAGSGSSITREDLLERIEAGSAPTIVDVRFESEHEGGHVPGAISVPFYAALSRADQIPTPRDEPVVVYCAHGPRAGIARLAFRTRGFQQVQVLEGHMTGWREAGFPIEVPAAGPDR